MAFEVVNLSMETDDPLTGQVLELVCEEIYYDRQYFPLSSLVGPGADFYGLVRDQSIIAAGGLLSPDIDGAAHLQVLAVQQEFQGKGIGGAFLCQLERAAAERYDATELTLEPTEYSEGFYTRQGYETSILCSKLMVKTLADPTSVNRFDIRGAYL